MVERQIEVQCYSGYKAGERPLRIRLGNDFVDVAEIEDRWYSPGVILFRVRLVNGDRYILRHLEAQDVWTLDAFRGGSTMAVH